MNRILAIVISLVCTLPTSAVTLDMVLVGNAGNAPDTTGFGSVVYAYQIGKYEITAGQYTEFLNAVAKDDPNGLYNTSMTGSFGANIQQIGSSPNFSYSVAPDWANRPVNYVSFWDAARFTNWLHNGQPTGAQGPGTTEDGAYHDVGNQSLFGRNASAKFVIPTENEWYKAAYHNKNAGLAANYSLYPTGSNTTPGRDLNEATSPGNNANYIVGAGGYLIGSPYYRTEVGEFEISDSFYGTFDQGGNVLEWNDAIVNGNSRRVRGGSHDNSSSAMRADNNFTFGLPASDFANVGFRVVSIPANIPEPTTAAMLGTAALVLLTLRRR
jgi:formylglycine-generating enzyme required for sulfatase activity